MISLEERLSVTANTEDRPLYQQLLFTDNRHEQQNKWKW